MEWAYDLSTERATVTTAVAYQTRGPRGESSSPETREHCQSAKTGNDVAGISKTIGQCERSRRIMPSRGPIIQNDSFSIRGQRDKAEERRYSLGIPLVIL